MTRWNLKRESRQRKRNALLLLTVAGALRPADVEIRYQGTDRLFVTWSKNSDRRSTETVENRPSIWNTDIRELWKTYRQGSAPQHPAH
jgi:hypothetical protein